MRVYTAFAHVQPIREDAKAKSFETFAAGDFVSLLQNVFPGKLSFSHIALSLEPPLRYFTSWRSPIARSGALFRIPLVPQGVKCCEDAFIQPVSTGKQGMFKKLGAHLRCPELLQM